MKKSISSQNIFYILCTIAVLGFVLVWCKTVFIPMAFALLLSFMLYPICRWMERKNIRRLWAIIWTMTLVVSAFVALIYLFSSQLIIIGEEFQGFTAKINKLVLQTARALSQLPLVNEVSSDEIVQRGKDWIKDSGGAIMADTITATSTIFSGLIIVLVCTFLILLYRSGFKNALLKFARKENRDKYQAMLVNMQTVGQRYVVGMVLLIGILGSLNTLGLWLIGIEYALFFGFFAAALAIIPYIGTTLGGAIPTLYAFLNCDSIFYPLGIIAIFAFIQFVEGNFLTPKIVGGNLQVNALVAIFSLLLGGLMWGISGMILFLPFVSILREFCKAFKPLKPLAFILGDKLYKTN